MKKISVLSFCAGLLLASCSSAPDRHADYQVIPLPQEIVAGEGGDFTLTSNTVIAYTDGDTALATNASLLAGYINELTGFSPEISVTIPTNDAIVLLADLKDENPEAYELTVTDHLITINGASAAGNFYGIQTLRKSIPATASKGNVIFAPVTINDKPRFSYRGAHFDVARHFFPVDSVKSFIDMLALHNINKLHWHLTEDQGWRIEIKKYPRLTEVGSKRAGTCIGHDFDSSDSIPYGGFYTQDEARDIVKYAQDRYITVIPEIDLPGHMLGALASYPHLGCTGGPYEVWQRWGVADDVLCAGNDSTLIFIDDVLDEICDIFPSEYIHIGGDECPKVRWKECEKCQARIRQLGLKDDAHGTKEDKLQSYIMEHAANTVAKHNRKMIGWDEILEGGLFPGATVMSWRGEEAAVEAAKKGHDAILTPTNYCYFDYSQSLDRDKEPLGIGGFVPVEKVYQLEPVGKSLTPEEATHILGAQANLWTEYMKDFYHVQYMELPRLAAMAEVQWTQAEKKDYSDFTKRLPGLIHHYDLQGYNYAKHIFDINGKLVANPENNSFITDLSTIDDAPIHYTLDGSEPTEKSPVLTEPVVIDKTTVIKAVAVRPEGNSRVWVDSVSFNKATTHDIILENEPHSRYNSGGAALLTDGHFGGASFNTGDWLGFVENSLVATIDLGSEQEISSVAIRFLVNTPNWIFDARKISVAVSADGTDFTEVAVEEYPQMTEHVMEVINHVVKFTPVKAKFVKVTADPENAMPAWHGVGEGKPAFIFVDEIVVD